MRQALAFWLRRRVEAVWLILVVAMATAVATTVWSIANGVWFNKLPYQDPDRLVSLGWKSEGSPDRTQSTSIQEFEDLKRATRDLCQLAAWETDWRWYLDANGAKVEISGAAATTNLFDVLGLRAEIGRVFEEDDAASGTAAIISDKLWTTAFNRDPGVIGRTIAVFAGSQRDNRSIQIVGVLPPGGALRKPDTTEVDLMVAVPDGLRPGGPMSRRVYSRILIARLNSGVQIPAFEAATTPLFREIDRLNPLWTRTRSASVIGLHEVWFGRTRPFLLLLAASAAFLLLVAASNGVGVMLALGSRRAREMAVRTAIGARRRDLITQALCESAVISGGAMLLSMGAAAVMVRVFAVVGPSSVPRLSEAHVDWSAALFAGGVAAAFCVSLGLLPAIFRRQGDVLFVLQSGGNNSTASRRTLLVRRAAIAIQVAVVLALLAAAGLVSSTLWRMLSQPLGFDPTHTGIARVTPTKTYFKDPPTYQRVMNDIRRSAATAPGVVEAALAFDPPLAEAASSMQVRFLDQPAKFVGTKMVSDGYFSTMRIPLLAGRDFVSGDFVSGDFVIVNEMFARTYFGGVAQAVGREIDFGTRRRVIGVVGNVREEGLTAPLKPILYPVLSAARWTPGQFHVVVRYRGSEASALHALSDAVRRADQSSHVEVVPLDQRITTQTAVARTQVGAVAVVALSALLLAAIGIYATIAQVVEDRQREMAIRSALGASGRSLVVLAAHGVGLATLAGVVGGGLFSWVVARVTRQFLFEMSPFDPVVWLAAASLLVGVALLASWWPARRAANVDPAVVLRQS